jgi:hypothetical protein
MAEQAMEIDDVPLSSKTTTKSDSNQAHGQPW